MVIGEVKTVVRFAATKRASETDRVEALVRRVLAECFPDALGIHKAHSKNDMVGADYWIEMAHGRFIAVDCKVRAVDYATSGKPDLALETWANLEREKPGWTRDPGKLSDFILWLWTDTQRHCLVCYPMLRAVFSRRWQEWARRYRTARQKTQSESGAAYTSECLFISSRDLHRELFWAFGGVPGAQGKATKPRAAP